MPWDSTKDDWERLGQLDPYWAVLGQDAYRRRNMSDDQLARFLESGEAYVEHLWRRCREAFGTSFSPVRALDFGCGVGRVALPMAKFPSFAGSGESSPPFRRPLDFQPGPSVRPIPVGALAVSMRFR